MKRTSVKKHTLNIYIITLLISITLFSARTTHADINHYYLKDLYQSLQEQYQKYSPMKGFIYTKSKFLKNAYVYAKAENESRKLLQYLFNLHEDGVNFVPSNKNQNISKHLDASAATHIISQIALYKENKIDIKKMDEQLNKYLVDYLSKKGQTTQKLIDDQKANIVKIENELKDLKQIYAKRGPFLKNKIKTLEKFQKQQKEDENTNKINPEELLAKSISERAGKIDNMKKEIEALKTKNIEDEKQLLVLESKEKEAKLSHDIFAGDLRKNKISFNIEEKVLEFLNILKSALSTTDKSSGLDEYFVLNSFLALFWKKATDLNDVENYFKVFRENNLDILKTEFSNDKAIKEIVGSRYNEEEIKLLSKNKEASFANPEEEHMGLLEKLYYGDKFPLISYDKITLKDGRSLPDCVESTLLNIVNSLIFDKKARKFDLLKLESKGIFIPESIKIFYKEFSTPDQMETPQARNAWGEIVSNLNQKLNLSGTDRVKYMSADDSIELDSDYDNINKVFKALFKENFHPQLLGKLSQVSNIKLLKEEDEEDDDSDDDDGDGDDDDDDDTDGKIKFTIDNLNLELHFGSHHAFLKSTDHNQDLLQIKRAMKLIAQNSKSKTSPLEKVRNWDLIASILSATELSGDDDELLDEFWSAISNNKIISAAEINKIIMFLMKESENVKVELLKHIMSENLLKKHPEIFPLFSSIYNSMNEGLSGSYKQFSEKTDITIKILDDLNQHSDLKELIKPYITKHLQNLYINHEDKNRVAIKIMLKEIDDLYPLIAQGDNKNYVMKEIAEVIDQKTKFITNFSEEGPEKVNPISENSRIKLQNQLDYLKYRTMSSDNSGSLEKQAKTFNRLLNNGVISSYPGIKNFLQNKLKEIKSSKDLSSIKNDISDVDELLSSIINLKLVSEFESIIFSYLKELSLELKLLPKTYQAIVNLSSVKFEEYNKKLKDLDCTTISQ